MLNNGNKLSIIIIVLAFFSCNNKDDIKEKTINYKLFSKNTIGNDYEKVYKDASDSLLSWSNCELETYTFLNLFPFQLDSLLCFNQNRDKMIGAILSSDNEINTHVGDGIDFIFGAKILGKWYFKKGPSIFLPREMYQKDTDKPLSFEKLHEIAMKEVFSGYLKKKKKDLGFWRNLLAPEYEYEINDNFFKELNQPRVPFAERNDPNCPFSCRTINNEKEYAECLWRKDALSIWNPQRAYIKSNTRLYAPKLPLGKEVVSTLEKGESFKVIEYIDNRNWVYVRMEAHRPNLGLIKREDISLSKPN